MASFRGGNSQCNSCSRTLKNETGLLQHMADKHGFPFNCTTCNQQISSRDQIWQHVSSHGLPRFLGGRRRRRNRNRNRNTTALASIPSYGASSLPLNFTERFGETALSSKKLRELSSSDNLDLFVEQVVQPDEAYLDSCHAAVDRLVKFLQNSLPERYRPSEIIKGGSLGKGTAVKDKSDIDLTLFLSTSRFPTVRSVKIEMDSILQDLSRYLSEYGECGSPEKKVKAVQVTLSCHHGHTHDVDILPACKLDIDTASERQQIYRKMNKEDSDIAGYYVPSLSPLQIEFIKSERPTKLKTLIRLVKYWVKEEVNVQPSSLLFELITIKCWENACRPVNFDLRNGLFSVLSCLKNYSTLEAEWFAYYSQPFARSLVSHTKPYVIDPDNPLCELMCKYGHWPYLKGKAQDLLRAPLLQGITGGF